VAASKLGTKPAQVEEQRLLRRARTTADNRPVTQDIVLHRGANPPTGIGREAHVARRLEPRRRLEQSDVTFLNKIAHGQAETAELGSHGDHQAHMRERYLVAGVLI